MFEDQDRDAVFLETCMNPRGHRHMAIECVPLPKEIGDMAPIYFKVCCLLHVEGGTGTTSDGTLVMGSWRLTFCLISLVAQFLHQFWAQFHGICKDKILR